MDTGLTPLMALRTPLKSLAFYLKTATLSNHFMKRMEDAGFPKEKKSSAKSRIYEVVAFYFIYILERLVVTVRSS